MGVPLLLTWLRRRFAECFLPAEGEASASARHSDNLFVDLNSLLYQSAQILASRGGRFDSVDDVEDKVLRKLFDILDDIIFDVVMPEALVYLAVDGISPLGKMSQQRTRRRRQSSRRTHHGGGGSSAGQYGSTMDTVWDSNCISVGTRFMAKVTEALHFYAVSRTERINAKRFQEAAARCTTADGPLSDDHASAADAQPFRPIAIIVDDVLRPGEGENKISEAIRRMRAQPDYNPNTSHVICSSDTDVTVSSLILHEPRLHVLRYEPPPSVGGKEQRPASGNSHNNYTDVRPGRDSFSSTFFSIHIFRQRLFTILGFGEWVPQDEQLSADQTAAAAFFERALHDVVFVMLLFGNDFLPTLGGSIQEGALDALLSLLATDFISRGHTIVDAETNQIQFTTARYLLDCLTNMRGGGANNPDGLLRVVSGHGGGGTDAWGFDADPSFTERQRIREKEMELKCYSYWTMLQWALQYSAGVVEHWGCYYPFNDAPPTHFLKKYCGMFSYERLVAVASTVVRAKRARHRGETPTAGISGSADTPDPALGLLEEVGGCAPPGGDEGEGDAAAARRAHGKPTDVLVQLLVLIPRGSAQLLPGVLRSHYNEIEEAVQAPVEQLDLGHIAHWCEEKRNMLTEEERTRFTSYQLFASDKIFTAPLKVVPPTSGADACLVNGPYQPSEAETETTQMPANEIVFAASWPLVAAEKELAALREKARAAASAPSTAVVAAGVVPATKPSSIGSAAASFFGARKTGKTSASTAAALLAKATPSPSPALPTPPLDEPSPSSGKASTPPAQNASPSADDDPLLRVRERRGTFILICSSLARLKDETLRRALGCVQGTRFSVGSYKPTSESAAALSADSITMRVRLRWSMAVAPPLTVAQPQGTLASSATHLSGLLKGYLEPVAGLTFMELVRRQRQKEQEQQDVWRRKAVKRARSDGEGDVNEGEHAEDGEAVVAAASQSVASASAPPTPSPPPPSLSTESPQPEGAMSELDARKLAMRNRLLALKAATQDV